LTLRRTDRGGAPGQHSTAPVSPRSARGGGKATLPAAAPHAPRCVELAQTRGGRVLPGFPSGLALNPSCHAGLYPRPGSRVNGRPTRTESGSHVVTMKAMITTAAAVLAGHPHVPVGRWEASWGHHLAAITSIAGLADGSATQPRDVRRRTRLVRRKSAAVRGKSARERPTMPSDNRC